MFYVNQKMVVPFALILSFFMPVLVFSQTISDTIAPSIDLSLPFNLVATGQQSGPETVTLLNPSSVDSFKIRQIQLTGPDSEAFSLDVNGGTSPCGSNTPTLSPGGSCTLTLRFRPNGTGSRSAFLNLSLGTPMVAFHDTTTGKKGISLYNLSTKETTVLTTPGSGQEDSHPSWSPDGRQIVFNRHKGLDVSGTIMTVPIDQSTGPVSLFGNAGTPAWSPDGRKIAYRDNNNGGIGFFDFEMGFSDQFFGSTASGELRDPSWSPEGNALVFRRGAITGSPSISKVSLSFDGFGAISAISEKTGPLSEKGKTPAWSPDGKKIAFHNTETKSIDRLDPDGNVLGTITNPPVSAEDTNPSWSPDSKQIIFHRSVNLQDQIIIIDADGSVEPPPISTTGLTPSWSPDLPQLTLSGTGLPADTNSPPSVPQLLAPEAGQTGLSTSVTLSWFPSSDPEGHAIHYQYTVCETAGLAGCEAVQVAKSKQKNGVMFAGIGYLFFGISFITLAGQKKTRPSFIVLMIAVQFFLAACGGSGGGGGGDGKPPAPKALTQRVKLEAGRTYFWQITAIDALGEETKSEIRQFST